MYSEEDLVLLRKALEGACWAAKCTKEAEAEHIQRFLAIAKGEDKDTTLAQEFRKLFDRSREFHLNVLQKNKPLPSEEDAHGFAFMMTIIASSEYVKTGEFIFRCNTSDVKK